jgi:hypothetical protein
MTDVLPLYKWQEFDFDFMFFMSFKGMEYNTYAGKMNL